MRILEIVHERRHQISEERLSAVLLSDEQGHLSILYESSGNVAQHFQEGFCPIVYPEPEYEVETVGNPYTLLKRLG